jgi:outer membrane phospholipase A
VVALSALWATTGLAQTAPPQTAPPQTAPPETASPTAPVATGLPPESPGLNPIAHQQAGAPPQRTTGTDQARQDPRFWLFNDNYFSWQPNSPGRTTVKFQISVRYDMIYFDGGRQFTFSMGYTQKSFWDLFAFSRSSPFVENDYKPEGFLSFRPHPRDRVTEVMLGILHESNGLGMTSNVDQTLDSRGWNNVYLGARYGFDRRSPAPGIELYLTLGGRAWLPFVVLPDNLPHYLGYASATVNLDIRLANHPSFGQIALELIAHERSIQGHAYLPLEAFSNGHLRFSLYGQIFHGDAERLITFDKNVTTYAVGFGFI